MPERMSDELKLAFDQADSVKVDSLVAAYDWNFTIAFSDEPMNEPVATVRAWLLLDSVFSKRYGIRTVRRFTTVFPGPQW